MNQDNSKESSQENNADTSNIPKPGHTGDDKEEERPLPKRPSDKSTHHSRDRQPSPVRSTPSTTHSEPQWKTWLNPRPDYQIGFLQNQNRELKQDVFQLRQTVAGKDKEIAQVLARLAEKESELEEMKKTLCMYDDCSAVEIAGALSGINSRIKSLTQNTAQRWMRDLSKAPGDERPPSDTELEGCRRVIGTQLVDAFRSPALESNGSASILLPLAWQASIVAVVAKILSAFAAGLPTLPDGMSLDNVLQTISGTIKTEEAQPAYGRWRFITHKHLRRWMHKEEEAVQNHVNEALNHCHLAARLAMQGGCPNNQIFLDAFQAQTQEIIKEAFKLRTNIQERVLTANYDPYLPANGTPFRADVMGIDEDDRRFDNDVVVCTVRLGMTCSRKNGRDSSSNIRNELFEKPVVLTHGNLEDIVAGK